MFDRGRDCLHAVMTTLANIISGVVRPFTMGMSHKVIAAPPMIPKPMGKARTPMPTGSLPGALGQPLQILWSWSSEKKLTIHVVALRWPQKEKHEVITAAPEGD